MGRKGQGHRSKHEVKTKNQRNLSSQEKDIIENVDKLLRISTIPQPPNVLKALENQREISLVTNKLKDLEINKDLSTSVGNRATTATIDHFIKWVNENGAELKGCSITEFEGFELGFKVNTDIPQSSLVIAVPRKLMLSIETARNSELKDLMKKDQILKNMHNVALAIYLLFEKFNENSFWRPYIDILPTIYSTVLYFSVDDLEELKGSPTLEIALRQVKSIARQYAYFHKLFHSSDDSVSRIMRDRFTYKEYCQDQRGVLKNILPGRDYN